MAVRALSYPAALSSCLGREHREAGGKWGCKFTCRSSNFAFKKCPKHLADSWGETELIGFFSTVKTRSKQINIGASDTEKFGLALRWWVKRRYWCQKCQHNIFAAGSNRQAGAKWGYLETETKASADSRCVTCISFLHLTIKMPPEATTSTTIFKS